METLCCFVAPPSRCGYLPAQLWQLEYEVVADITPAEYMARMRAGWRRFGDTLFHPRCPACTACRSLRVLVDRFRPSRSQQRCRKLNEGAIRLEIGKPAVSRARLRLYDRYHAYQSDAKGWPQHPAKDAASYASSFVDNPFPTQEWCYYQGDRLVGVGYVDDLPGGLSAIYFFYDPDERDRSLGTWNVLSILDYAARRSVPHFYLGYYVPGCGSMEYKTRFRPNQLLDGDGQWRDFRLD
jgi:arginine-tRNA-protein transferase